MSLNQDRIYAHLPARYRREDADLFLKRFLTFAGETMDGWDDLYDGFAGRIDPATAPVEWIEFWLAALFNWAWFPSWFTVDDKRTLYAHFARHLARRGTAEGIRLWLADFGLAARVWTRPAAWCETPWGEPAWSVEHPLGLVIEILHLKDKLNFDASFYGDAAWGECLWTEPKPTLTPAEIQYLLRFEWPLANDLWVVWSNFPAYEVPYQLVNFERYVVTLPL
jgi:phage tail-like protein